MSLKDVRVRAPLWARERISSALRSIVCKLLTIFVYRSLCLRSRARGAPPRYPLPKSLPSGEGLGGRSRRSRAQMGPYTHATEASFSSIQFPLPPAIFQGPVSEVVTKRVTARGILTRAPCQFRLYKCLILKRFLSP